MLFNSYEFIFIYLPIVLFLFYFLERRGSDIAAKIWLLVMSFYFYAQWNIQDVPLFLISLLGNYLLSFKLIPANQYALKLPARKILLIIGLILNLALLIYYKFTTVLPLGISFYTLQQISYLVDAYQGLVEDPTFIDYALYISFFSRVMSGPITAYTDIVPQWRDPQRKAVNYQNLSKGVLLFFIGLFKKLIFGDLLLSWASDGFAHPHMLTFLDSWATILSYTFGLYFDFSGYSDMAVGLALMFNIEFINNFNSPFKATSLIDFWNRWHISLTQFINAYVYTPLLRAWAPISFLKAMVSTFLTMLIVGFWHGASWGFIIFGAIHGIGLVVNHTVKKNKIKIPNPIAWLLTFFTVNVALVFLRASHVSDAIQILKAIFNVYGIAIPVKYSATLRSLSDIGIHFKEWGIDKMGIITPVLFCFFLFMLLTKSSSQVVEHFQPNQRHWIFLVFLIVLSLLNLSAYQSFVYINF